jgi:hypothetical protein
MRQGKDETPYVGLRHERAPISDERIATGEECAGRREFRAQGDLNMKSHMDGEVKWVWIVTSVAILYIITLYANSAGG